MVEGGAVGGEGKENGEGDGEGREAGGEVVRDFGGEGRKEGVWWGEVEVEESRCAGTCGSSRSNSSRIRPNEAAASASSSS